MVDTNINPLIDLITHHKNRAKSLSRANHRLLEKIAKLENKINYYKNMYEYWKCQNDRLLTENQYLRGRELDELTSGS